MKSRTSLWSGALRDTADRAGFQAHRQMVELVGVCRDCSAAAA